MPYRIKNNDDTIGYYANGHWSLDENNAQKFADETLAQNIISQHQMNATVEEVDEPKPPKSSKK